MGWSAKRQERAVGRDKTAIIDAGADEALR
jgi:hypothetical protein